MWQDVVTAVRRCVGTPGRRWLLAVTLAVGAAVGAALTAAGEAAVADPVQSLMSVTVPLLGILLIRNTQRAFAATVLAAVPVAAATGVFGALVCAAAAGSAAQLGRLAVAGVLVQVLAQLVGTGAGLLLRPAPVAFLATFLPLVVWLALGTVDALRPARAWLTPYETARLLLAGEPAWPQWVIVALLWGAGLNAAGVCVATGRQSRRTASR